VACHLQPAFAHLGLGEGALPGAEALAREVLSLPMWPQMPLDDVDRVAAAIRSAA
jgi:dTDP-4-amino-4,6-dideoxygalactose transaminase